MPIAYIALGANLGDRLGQLRSAVDRLDRLGIVDARSPVYETDPVGYRDQPAYLNAVVRLQTALEPKALLRSLFDIERELGRTRPFADAPRTIDLDLLFYDDLVLQSADLTVPHPRLHERAFVLAPLADLAPELIHPVLGRSVASLLDEVDRIGVRPFREPLSESGNTPAG
jgi:2-amino-4-hydroxy-6-hydroxymethyldihydropteridine diphosphokinase